MLALFGYVCTIIFGQKRGSAENGQPVTSGKGSRSTRGGVEEGIVSKVRCGESHRAPETRDLCWQISRELIEGEVTGRMKR